MTLVSEALIDQSMVMAKTGLEVWLDLLGAIGRLGSMGFFSARGHGLHWTCDARILDQRTGLAMVPSSHSPLHLLLLQPLTLLLLLPLHQRLIGRMAPGRLYGGSHSVHCTVLCALYSPSSSPSLVTGPRGRPTARGVHSPLHN